MAKDGLTKCVDSDGNRWKADASCCPVGFSATGFSLRAATEFFDPKNEGVTRHLYRHLVCIQDLPPAPVSP